MRPSLLLYASTLTTLTTSLAIEKRHQKAWPSAIRAFYSAAYSTLSQLPPQTLNTITSSTCNIASPSMPTIPDLPPVTPGYSLYHVAIGRGTQNYTCNPTDPTAVPMAAGATATLYNTTCISTLAPLALAQLPASALLIPTPQGPSAQLFPARALVSGQHYFTAAAPTFNLHTATHNYGIQFGAVLAKVAVPEKLQAGQTGQDGSKPVPWLKLSSADASNGLPADASPVKEVYRVNTAGGSAPKTCEGMEKTFEVQYAAEYWFWG
ncbi:MAG: hypothetical protein L6R40_004065 [Gallowayella cf. fulva]|nr:MAG: hypothetical protein L6R40_004065 [Xanthomendoza cf. fulva]